MLGDAWSCLAISPKATIRPTYQNPLAYFYGLPKVSANVFAKIHQHIWKLLGQQIPLAYFAVGNFVLSMSARGPPHDVTIYTCTRTRVHVYMDVGVRICL